MNTQVSSGPRWLLHTTIQVLADRHVNLDGAAGSRSYSYSQETRIPDFDQTVPLTKYIMSATMSSYVVDLMWQLTNCFNCFPSNPALKINGRSYKILRLLGEGGFSYVYLVQSPPSPNLYALKKIRCPFGAESVALALKEVEAYSLFQPHPNIIHALDHAVIPDRSDPSAKTVYILLPYYRRGNLQDAINANLVNGAKFPERRLMILFRGVCVALQAMHNYKVGGAPGGKGAQSRAKRVRADAARADRGEDHGDDDDELEDAEPLMEGEISMAQEGMSEGQHRAYAHRDIKPGKKRYTQHARDVQILTRFRQHHDFRRRPVTHSHGSWFISPFTHPHHITRSRTPSSRYSCRTQYNALSCPRTL